MPVPIVDKGYYPKKDTMIYYSEVEDYFDEYKEYRKDLILMPKGVNNKNIII